MVVAAGGDGTLNAVAQAVLGSGCAFGVLPQGTFNYFSRTHGIPADTARRMQVLLHEQAQPVQVGLVNERVFLVNASLGLYPKLLEDREGWKQQFGRSRLVAFGAGLATLLRGHRSLRLHIDVHGQRARRAHAHAVRRQQPPCSWSRSACRRREAVDRGALAAVLLRPVGALGDAGGCCCAARFGRLGEADQVLSFAFERLTVRARGASAAAHQGGDRRRGRAGCARRWSFAWRPSRCG